MRSYTNPNVAKPIDYNVIDRSVDSAMKDIGKSMSILSEKRRLAQDKLNEDLKEYNDLTYIERVKGLDESSNQAIRDSVATNMIDFSNMSQYEKNQNLQYIKDIKASKSSMESIMEAVATPGIQLDARIDSEYINLAKSLASADGSVSFAPKENGVGFDIIHTYTDDEGKESVEVFDQSKIISMGTMFKDVGGTIDGIQGKFDKVASTLSKNAVMKVNAGGTFDYEEASVKAMEVFDTLTEQEKSIYFSNSIDKGAELRPQSYIKDGKKVKLTESQSKAIYEENKVKMDSFIKDRIKERIIVALKNKPIFRPLAEKKSRYSEEDYTNAKKFKMDVAYSQSSQTFDKLKPYLNSANIDLKFDESSGIISFHKLTSKNTSGVDKNGDKFNTNSDSNELVDQVNINDANGIYQAVKKWSQEQSFFNLLDKPETDLTQEELTRSRVKKIEPKRAPIASDSDRAFVAKYFKNKGATKSDVDFTSQDEVDKAFGSGVKFDYNYGYPVSVTIDGVKYPIGSEYPEKSREANEKLEERYLSNKEKESSSSNTISEEEAIKVKRTKTITNDQISIGAKNQGISIEAYTDKVKNAGYTIKD